jgi:hypothetical protein
MLNYEQALHQVWTLEQQKYLYDAQITPSMEQELLRVRTEFNLSHFAGTQEPSFGSLKRIQPTAVHPRRKYIRVQETRFLLEHWKERAIYSAAL